MPSGKQLPNDIHRTWPEEDISFCDRCLAVSVIKLNCSERKDPDQLRASKPSVREMGNI